MFSESDEIMRFWRRSHVPLIIWRSSIHHPLERTHLNVHTLKSLKEYQIMLVPHPYSNIASTILVARAHIQWKCNCILIQLNNFRVWFVLGGRYFGSHNSVLMIHWNDVNAHGIDYPVYEIRILLSDRLTNNTHYNIAHTTFGLSYSYSHSHAHVIETSFCVRLWSLINPIARHKLKNKCNSAMPSSEMNAINWNQIHTFK